MAEDRFKLGVVLLGDADAGVVPVCLRAGAVRDGVNWRAKAATERKKVNLVQE